MAVLISLILMLKERIQNLKLINEFELINSFSKMNLFPEVRKLHLKGLCESIYA